MENSTSAAGRISTSVADSIGWIVIDNEARRNAISQRMFEDIGKAVWGHEADGEVRVIVLRGAGDVVFAAGADISQIPNPDHSPDQLAAFEAALFNTLAALETCRKPTLAMIHGYWIGGAAAVALRCDIRIADERSKFAITPAKLGLAYDCDNTRKLVEIVGPAFAKEILMTARQFTADEALRMGLVNKIVAKADLAASVGDYAKRLAANAPLSVAAAKAAVAAALAKPDEAAIARAKEQIDACFNSRDYEEGRRAFAEKRPPKFEGR